MVNNDVFLLFWKNDHVVSLYDILFHLNCTFNVFKSLH